MRVLNTMLNPKLLFKTSLSSRPWILPFNNILFSRISKLQLVLRGVEWCGHHNVVPRNIEYPLLPKPISIWSTTSCTQNLTTNLCHLTCILQVNPITLSYLLVIGNLHWIPRILDRLDKFISTYSFNQRLPLEWYSYKGCSIKNRLKMNLSMTKFHFSCLQKPIHNGYFEHLRPLTCQKNFKN